MSPVQVFLAALALWGFGGVPTWEFEVVPEERAIPGMGAWTWPFEVEAFGWPAPRCYIGLRQSTWDNEPEHRRISITAHEIGHCIGVAHWPEGLYPDSIMGGGHTVTSADMAEAFRVRRPLPFRVPVPGLAR